MVKVIKTMDQRNSIRVALIGCVSSGKSTLLNSICVNQYEDMKRKRTTMLPSVYKTSNKSIYRNKSEKERIKRKNKELNEKFYEAGSQSKESKVTIETCELQENIIPLIENFVDLPDDVFLDIYDIPGLNDCETKDIYFQWVKNNFHEFDLILNVLSIENGCNTSDEKDILNLITDCIHNEKVTYDRTVLFLTVINKCDDMEIHDGKPSLIDKEDVELFDQIINTTKEVIKEKYGDKICTYGFSPITARDTYIYRMLHYDPNSELDITLINKFGLNEVGKKKWNSKYKTVELKRKFIKDYFSDNVDIGEILEQTGYMNFRHKMNSYLTKDTQSLILINRLKRELQNEEIMNKNITKDVDEMKQLINLYNNYCIKVQTIDKIYTSNNSSLVTNLIYNHISRWINDISDLSNDKQESIERLQEYKCIMMMLRNTIDTYALKSKVALDISEGKDKRWDDSFGFTVKEKYAGNLDGKRFTLSKLFDNLYKGYSMLQNEYYEKQLKDQNNYSEFPNKLFPIIDKLKDNRIDNIESLLDDIITLMKNSNYMYGLIDGPISGINPDGVNCIKLFCESIMKKYDYPKLKVIEFIQDYCMFRYKMYKNGWMPSSYCSITHPMNGLYGNLEKSYTILLDEYLDYSVPRYSKVDKFLKNLIIVNKSYISMHSSSLDHTIDYMNYKDDILCLPHYLCSLMSDSSTLEEDETFYETDP